MTKVIEGDMTVDFEGFAKIPVIDCHIHFTDLEKVQQILDVVSRADFHRVAVLSLATTRLTNAAGPNSNPEALVLKALHPETFYAFGSLDYFPLLRGNHSPSLSEQVDMLETIGFDGIKMVEGKPNARKSMGIKFDDTFYEDYFKSLEEKRLALLFHVADPEEFWDSKKVPSWAKEQGWFYDSTYSSKQQLYDEVGNVLDKHSGLRVIFAHFYFLSANLEAASDLLDNHKNVHLDLTPGIEMYYNFSAKHDLWREFFLKYQDRILFGTDISSGQNIESALARAWFVRNFLETDSKFRLPSESDSLLEVHAQKQLRGLNLPRAALEKIYYENFRRLVGSKPRRLDLDLAIKECDRLSNEEALLKGKPVYESTATVAISIIEKYQLITQA